MKFCNRILLTQSIRKPIWANLLKKTQ